ncbi:cytochrome d ubiquinol oxidase subunit II [candidate division KSB1 bacterium]
MDLNITWFFLYSLLIAGYAVLDGFDLGVGVLHLFAKTEEEKRIHINAIAPVWDGNEVWLLTAGGALFAAFPIVYATVFSSFYLALTLLLFALIFRAVSMEFRGKVDSDKWRSAWDKAFGFGSLLPAILFGVALGNILRGLPLNSEGVFTGSFFGLLNPFSVLIGVFSLVTLVMHGAIYMTMKSDGALKERMQKTASSFWMAFVVIYALVTIFAFFAAPHLFVNVLSKISFWIFFMILLGSIIYQPVALKAGRFFRAFLSSSTSIVCLIGLAAVGIFPRMVPSITNLDYSLTIYNASSTQMTLWVMLVIALLGMPIVLGYTFFIYRKFKGKVVIDESSY